MVKFQSLLGGRKIEVANHSRETHVYLATVVGIDYITGRVEVTNGLGRQYAFVLRQKGGPNGGYITMPNVGDTGVVIPLHGDSSSLVWLGNIDSVQASERTYIDANLDTLADLTHRDYYRHETGSYHALNALGSFILKMFGKAATEQSPAGLSAQITLDNLGNLNITQYNLSNQSLKQWSFVVSPAGSFTLTVYQNDGMTSALQIQSDNLGNTTINSAIQTAINGGQALAFSSALSTLKSQLNDVVAKVNAMTYPVAVTTGPGAGSTGIAGPTLTPITEPPISPIGTEKTIAG